MRAYCWENAPWRSCHLQLEPTAATILTQDSRSKQCCTRTVRHPQVEIPNVDDHISKLEHMGKETVKKLADIRGSAQVGWAAAPGAQWQLAASHL